MSSCTSSSVTTSEQPSSALSSTLPSSATRHRPEYVASVLDSPKPGAASTTPACSFALSARTAVVTRQAESVAIGKPAISTSTVAPASAWRTAGDTGADTSAPTSTATFSSLTALCWNSCCGWKSTGPSEPI